MKCGYNNCWRMFPDADRQADCCYNDCKGDNNEVSIIFILRKEYLRLYFLGILLYWHPAMWLQRGRLWQSFSLCRFFIMILEERFIDSTSLTLNVHHQSLILQVILLVEGITARKTSGVGLVQPVIAVHNFYTYMI